MSTGISKPHKLSLTAATYGKLQAFLSLPPSKVQSVTGILFGQFSSKAFWFPKELCDGIIPHLSGRDVCALSVVSKGFQVLVIESVCRLQGGAVNWLFSYGSYLKKVSTGSVPVTTLSIYEKMVSYRLSIIPHESSLSYFQQIIRNQTALDKLALGVILKALVALNELDAVFECFSESMLGVSYEDQHFQKELVYALCYSFSKEFHPKKVYSQIDRHSSSQTWGSFLAICFFKKGSAQSYFLNKHLNPPLFPSFAEIFWFFQESMTFCIEKKDFPQAIKLLKQYSYRSYFKPSMYTSFLRQVCIAFQETEFPEEQAKQRYEWADELATLISRHLPHNKGNHSK